MSKAMRSKITIEVKFNYWLTINRDLTSHSYAPVYSL